MSVRQDGLQVIGVGLLRTGTTSLKRALEILGYGPCYKLWTPSRHVADIGFWHAAAQSKPVHYDDVLHGYRSIVEPSAYFYKPLMAAYPDAKVILTVRDPERWFESVNGTILRRYRFAYHPVVSFLTSWIPRVRLMSGLGKSVVVNGVFNGDISDKERVIAAVRRYNAKVQAEVPPEKLLVFDVREGWEPLCRFLGVPVPAEPFPRVNTTSDFRTKHRRRIGTLGVALTALLVVVLLRTFRGPARG